MERHSFLPTGIIAYADSDCNIPIKIFLFTKMRFRFLQYDYAVRNPQNLLAAPLTFVLSIRHPVSYLPPANTDFSIPSPNISPEPPSSARCRSLTGKTHIRHPASGRLVPGTRPIFHGGFQPSPLFPCRQRDGHITGFSGSVQSGQWIPHISVRFHDASIPAALSQAAPRPPEWNAPSLPGSVSYLH